ncbi:cell division protein ZapE [Candidatus Liberibacter brunswickensis]|uniref:cell division protein ZapE n=1 Tax=Candidatus Liberibacter brunswickensis TaxID=1968796 RepID=UPI002FDF1364
MPFSDLVGRKLFSLIKDKNIKYNPDQHRVARSFDLLLSNLHEQQKLENSFFSWSWMGIKKKHYSTQGIYLYGGVGQGKSMLMNIFFDLVPIEKKCKIHFYEFMKNVHSRILMYRQKIESREISKSDLIQLVADSIFLEFTVLCFDELMVTNIADAVILSRLFAALFSRGCIIVMTSNFIPENLYKDGINRDLFIPFITILRDKLEVICLDSGKDYRRQDKKVLPVYITPLSSCNRVLIDRLWVHITKGKKTLSCDITAEGGYDVHIPAFCERSARFSFFDLCDRLLTANDFLEIATRFDIIIIYDIPLLKKDHKDWIKRFIMLIDVLYEHKTGLIISSEVDINNFFYDQGVTTFEFQRTVSRLLEMFSVQYVSRHSIIMDVCNILLSIKGVDYFLKY